MNMREVVIKPVLNGFIVQVGCQRLVYNSIDVLAADLVKYQKDPVAVEKEFRENATNKDGSICTEPITAGLATSLLNSYPNGGLVS